MKARFGYSKDGKFTTIQNSDFEAIIVVIVM